VKGPLAKMFRELGREPSALEAAREYRNVLRGFILDREDASQSDEIARLGMRVEVTETLMRDLDGRRELAARVLRFARTLDAG
jgi:LPPG:FO 2-phospho-L-lactate transferase